MWCPRSKPVMTPPVSTGCETKFLSNRVLPHKCGVPPTPGTPHLCGSEELSCARFHLPFRLELCRAGVGFINEDWFGLLAAHPGHCLSGFIGRAAAFGPDRVQAAAGWSGI